MKNNTLFFDCFAGASGNMILGGLVSLGVDQNELVSQIRGLKVSEFEIEFKAVNKSGISAIHADVRVPVEHVHRHLHDIKKILDESSLTERVRTRALEIFTRLAEAESAIHGIDVSKVHFHEVGALDSIIDVVGCCIGFEMLNVQTFACSRVHVGSGFAEMAHGKFPVPPPAVTELLKGIPIYSTEIAGELCTPTGAAIISTLSGPGSGSVELSVHTVGYGAGSRDYEGFPNVIRLLLGTDPNGTGTSEPPITRGVAESFETQVLLETNLDDTTGQVLGHVLERALELGALDCWFTPIQMKKNRPATMISILCDRENSRRLIELLYLETTTLGVRIREVGRQCLERKFVTVETSFGKIDVKIGLLNDKQVNAMPEFDQLKRIAIENNIPVKELKELVLAKLNEQQS